MRDDGCSNAADLVARRLERETGLRVCGGPRREGQALQHGRPVARHFAVTLGRPLRTGGYSPEAEVYYSIPIDTASEASAREDAVAALAAEEAS